MHVTAELCTIILQTSLERNSTRIIGHPVIQACMRSFLLSLEYISTAATWKGERNKHLSSDN